MEAWKLTKNKQIKSENTVNKSMIHIGDLKESLFNELYKAVLSHIVVKNNLLSIKNNA